MVDMRSKLEAIIIDKLELDLSDAIYHPYQSELWILNSETKEWYFKRENSGKLSYNEKYFNLFFTLFSLKYKEYQPILKKWFETTTKLIVREITRNNTVFPYTIENALLSNCFAEFDWDIDNRHGISFSVVKKYVDLKKKLNVDRFTLGAFLK